MCTETLNPPCLHTKPPGAWLGSRRAQLPQTHAQRQGTRLHFSTPLDALLLTGGAGRTPFQHHSYFGRLQQHLLCEGDIVHVVQRQLSACSNSISAGPLVVDCLQRNRHRSNQSRGSVPEPQGIPACSSKTGRGMVAKPGIV